MEKHTGVDDKRQQRSAALVTATEPGAKYAAAAKEDTYFVLSNGVEKSHLDDRAYLPFQLANGLRVLVVSDAHCDKAGAGMSVGVGHFEDEDALPGLAHFLEHMVFMGTAKYPDENEYSSFLSKCGGSSNACTEAEVTSFFFDVNHSNLYEMLDRFAQFFISPLMSETTQDREVRAVDSEHSKNILQDPWRFQQLERSSAVATHPYSKFGTGDIKTLETVPKQQGISVRAKLLEFHERHYKANRMGLVVIGRESLDTLRCWVEELFSMVPGDGQPRLMCEMQCRPTYVAGELFPTGVRNHLCFVEPIKERYSVEIGWEFPISYRDFRSQPLRYAEHILGHEGKGSLLANLKARGLASALQAGVGFECVDFCILKVTVECTEKGARESYQDVVAAVFEYCEMVRKAGVKEEIFREMQLLEEIRFRFQSAPETFKFARSASASLLRYPAANVFSAESVVKEFNPMAIGACLELLTPERARGVVTFKNIRAAFPQLAWQKERWYATDFAMDTMTLSEIVAKTTRGSEPAMALPAVNPFIPTSFELKATRDVSPEVKRQMQQRPPSRASGLPTSLHVFYKTDTVYGQPKAVMKCQIIAPLCYATPRASVLAELASMVAGDVLSEYTYDAEVAGMAWSWSNTARGMSLAVAGYSDCIQVLLDKIVLSVTSVETYRDEGILNRQVERMTRSLENFKKENAYQIAMYESGTALNVPRWSFRLKQQALKARKVTVEELCEFVRQSILGSTATVSTLCVGNITRLEAIAMSETVWSRFRFEPGMVPLPPRVVALPVNRTCFLRTQSEESVNSAIELVCQFGPTMRVDRVEAVSYVLVNLADEPCFNELRTKQQLGYIVSLGLRRDGTGVWGLRVVIQSSTFSVDDLVDRTITFLNNLGSILDAYSDEEFADHIESCVQHKLEADITLSSEARRWWDEIEQGTLKFERDQIVASQIKSVTRREVREFYAKHVSPASREKRYFISAVDPKQGTPGAPKEDLSSWGKGKLRRSLERRLYDEALGEIIELSPTDLSWWRDECDLYSFVERPALL